MGKGLKVALPLAAGLGAIALSGGTAAPAVAAAEGAGAGAAGVGAGVGGIASGLAGSGFLGTNLGATGGLLASAAPAAETTAAASGIDGLVANPMSPGNLIDPQYLANNFWGGNFVGDGNVLSKAGNFLGDKIGDISPSSAFNIGKTGLGMMGGGQQQAPQTTAVNSSRPAAPTAPPGSFASSANLQQLPSSLTPQELQQLQQRQWLSRLGTGGT